MVNFASWFAFFSLVVATNCASIDKPKCDASKDVSVRYASSSQRIYVESLDGTRGGCTSLTHIYNNLKGKTALYPLQSPGEWFLASELYVLDGITLQIYGTRSGGDCDYLKLKSDVEGHVYIRAHGGSLDLVNTTVTSWGLQQNSVDLDLTDGRAYLSAISEVLVDEAETCQGVAKNNKGESRMDIEGSEISHLGYKASEAWGISWKIRGLCNDLSNEEEYNGIGVYGNILNSDIHHLYYGHYSYGHRNGVFSGNLVHDNEVYGFDPHHGSVELVISENEVYNNGNHGIIFSKWCYDALVENNHVHDNVGVGIFAHWIGDRATIAGNLVEDNGDSGIAFLESSDGIVYNNVVRRNHHGIRFSVGSRDNIVLENTFEDNTGYDVYLYEGSDPVVEAPDGYATRNIFSTNTFSGNEEGFRFDDSVDSQFVENEVQDAKTFEVRDTTRLFVESNTFPRDMVFTLKNSCIENSTSAPCGESRMVHFTIDNTLEHSFVPTAVPSVGPSSVPSVVPSGIPSSAPSVIPTQGSRSIVVTDAPFSSLDSTLHPTFSPTNNVSNGHVLGKSVSGMLIVVGVILVCVYV